MSSSQVVDRTLVVQKTASQIAFTHYTEAELHLMRACLVQLERVSFPNAMRVDKYQRLASRLRRSLGDRKVNIFVRDRIVMRMATLDPLTIEKFQLLEQRLECMKDRLAEAEPSEYDEDHWIFEHCL
jgi:hypothetical protein